MACLCEKNDVRNRLHSSNFAHFYTRIITTHSLYKTFLCVRIFKRKVNSVQEACAKCFPVHILKFEILQTT